MLFVDLSHHPKFIYLRFMMCGDIGEDDTDIRLHLLAECGEVDVLVLDGKSMKHIERFADENNLTLEYRADIDYMAFDRSVSQHGINGVNLSVLLGEMLRRHWSLECLPKRVAININTFTRRKFLTHRRHAFEHDETTHTLTKTTLMIPI